MKPFTRRPVARGAEFEDDGMLPFLRSRLLWFLSFLSGAGRRQPYTAIPSTTIVQDRLKDRRITVPLGYQPQRRRPGAKR
jgi:hypothetical protein